MLTIFLIILKKYMTYPKAGLKKIQNVSLLLAVRTAPFPLSTMSIRRHLVSS